MCEPAIKYYEEQVKILIRENSNEIISNSSSKHAIILFKNFFKEARSSIYIFCGKLSKTVYDDIHVIDAMRSALENGIDVKVIISQKKPESTLFSELLRQYNKKINCLNAIVDINHFCVIDNCRYRLETDQEEKTAIACAYEENIGTKLSNIFNILDSNTLIHNNICITQG
ncbi:hypothetical protein [Akkermansia muciniphila]|jgi:hypothetical protein|uniref:hypothetical protein n=1 Tax=Akkermansia muciniphila TaxID=239935 RepID=UPI0011AFBDCC|nr:hypothetical protein [Akkermansia muciniphila]